MANPSPQRGFQPTLLGPGEDSLKKKLFCSLMSQVDIVFSQDILSTMELSNLKFWECAECELLHHSVGSS